MAIGDKDHGRVAMPVAAMLAGAVHQPLDLALGEIAPLDCQVYDAWVRFLDVGFMRINLACASPTVWLIGFSCTVVGTQASPRRQIGVAAWPSPDGNASKSSGRACASPPGGGRAKNRKFIQAPSPEIWSETISGGEEVLAGKWGGLFLGYLLREKLSAA